MLTLVRTEGIEPSTSVLSGLRSTTELCAQMVCFYSGIIGKVEVPGKTVGVVVATTSKVEVDVGMGETSGENIGNLLFIASNPSKSKDFSSVIVGLTLKLKFICSTKKPRLEITMNPKIRIIITAMETKIKF